MDIVTTEVVEVDKAQMADLVRRQMFDWAELRAEAVQDTNALVLTQAKAGAIAPAGKAWLRKSGTRATVLSQQF